MSSTTPDPELLAWIVLRRASRGGVIRVGDQYLDQSRPVPAHLVETVDSLTAGGLLALTDPEPVAEATQRVVLTASGRARYAALDQAATIRASQSPVCHRLHLDPEHLTTET